QTFADFECLVIDDGSTDDTIDVVKGFQDPRIKLFQQKNSGGPARPRNVGLKNSTGEYIFMFDSDDIMAPDKLATSVQALDTYPEADMLFSNFRAIDERGSIITPNFLAGYDSFWKLIGGRVQEGRVCLLTAKYIYAALVRVNFIGT